MAANNLLITRDSTLFASYEFHLDSLFIILDFFEIVLGFKVSVIVEVGILSIEFLSCKWKLN